MASELKGEEPQPVCEDVRVILVRGSGQQVAKSTEVGDAKDYWTRVANASGGRVSIRVDELGDEKAGE